MTQITEFISNFTATQFPAFYRDEGPEFIAFVKSYYEWLETERNVLNDSRNLLNYRNIDTTLDEFVNHFQLKYLYGIPRNILGDKKLLIKHAIDLYRSKGSVEGYKLLFRLLYNQDVDVYFPSSKILKTSDGVWKELKYVEIDESPHINDLISKQIIGFTSRATAIAEKFIKYPANNKIAGVLYISNIIGEFIKGEKLYNSEYEMNSSQAINGPRILGSVTNLNFVQGGRNFSIGDILKSYNSTGIDAEFRVSDISDSVGQIVFDIVDGGTYYSLDATEIISRIPINDIRSGSNASFNVGSITNITPITYNTDIIYYVKDVTIDANDYGYFASTANISSPMVDFLAFQTANFGTITSLTDINAGLDYDVNPNIIVRDLFYMDITNNNIYYVNNSVIATGINTAFTEYLYTSNASCALGAQWGSVSNATSLSINASTSSITGDVQVGALAIGSHLPTHPNYAFVTQVDTIGSNTVITLEFPTQNVSSASANSINFLLTSERYIKLFSDPANTDLFDTRKIIGVVNNTIIILDDFPNYSGNGNILIVSIANGGIGYSNSDTITVTANVSDTLAAGANLTIKTTESGEIYEVVINDAGTGYYNIPTANVVSSFGVNANLIITSTSNPKYQDGFPLLSGLFGENGTSNSVYYDLLRVSDGSSGGLNANITADASSGNGAISEVRVRNSGYGFNDNSIINLGKSGALTQPLIIDGGNNYTNGEVIIFSGGSPTSIASGEVITDSNGSIIDTNMIYFGSGYQSIPDLRVRTASGTGANLTTTIDNLDTTYIIKAIPIKTAVGSARGYWSSEQGFLNSDQKIQDSYYYQDYSYELRTSSSLNRYSDIVKKIFHLSGTELFGLAQFYDHPNSNSMIIANSEISSQDDNLISPTLEISFIDGTEFDQRIDFSRNSSAAYYDSFGVLKFAGNNIPRIDHDPITLDNIGLLVEDTSTNILKSSENFANSIWVKTGGSSVVANAVAAPDGYISGSLLNIPSGAAISQTISITPNVYASSIWIKSDQTTNLILSAQTDISPVSYSNVTCNTTWTRVYISELANTGSESTLTFSISDVEFPHTVYVWGGQCEIGVPSSYIPTTSSSNTRLQDSATISGNNFLSWFNSDPEGTFIIKAIWLDIETSPRIVFGISDSNFANSIYHTYSSAYSGWAAPAYSGNPEIPATISSGYNKIALAYSGNSRVSIVNGVVESGTPAIIEIPANTYTTLAFGGAWGALPAYPFSGHIQELVYFNYMKPNTSIQTLTTL